MDASQPEARILQMLNDAGLRPTRQRQQIAMLLFSRGDRHVTPEQLYQEARTDRYPPSLATIYNALGDFARNGLVREIAVYGSKTWFDTTVGPHSHYFIPGEDKLIDIPADAIPRIDITPPVGMRVASVDIIVRLEKTTDACR